MDILRCPVTKRPLTLLSTAEIAAVNESLVTELRVHRDRSEAGTSLESAMGTPNRDHLYRIKDGIAWLLPGLALVRSDHATTDEFAAEKKVVKAFYDDFGWVKKTDGVFNDTAEFTDARGISQNYRRYCNARIARLLGGGRFLLDVASGAIPHPEYLAFSDNYQIRICVDLSIRALDEARAKLGGRGLYLLGDITCLPLANGSVDSAISLHTIYHVPQAEQTLAVDELVRVTRSGGRTIIVYVWRRSPAMEVVFKLRGWLGFLRRFGKPSPVAAVAKAAAESNPPPLYFHPQNHAWFKHDIAVRHGARLRVWSAISTAFQIRFLSDGLPGRLIITLVKFFENALPAIAGRLGQYPMFIIDKP